MAFDTSALRIACYDVAKTTSWQPNDPISSSPDVITSKELRFFDISQQRALAFDGEHDPNVVARAVRYLGHMHAIPPMGDDEGWFRDMLEVLLELVMPSTEPIPEAAAFLIDVRQGVERTLSLSR